MKILWAFPMPFFGPSLEANRSVSQMLDAVFQHWPGEWVDRSDPGAFHEAGACISRLIPLTTNWAGAHAGPLKLLLSAVSIGIDV